MIYLCIVIKIQIVMARYKKYRVLSVHSNGTTSFFYRPTVTSCLNFIKQCTVNLFPSPLSVTYFVQEFNSDINDYVSFITFDYYYGLPF